MMAHTPDFFRMYFYIPGTLYDSKQYRTMAFQTVYVNIHFVACCDTFESYVP